MNYEDLLAEYLCEEEHQLHAQVLHLAHSFHAARAAAKAARAKGDDGLVDELDAQAERMAKIIEGVKGQR